MAWLQGRVNQVSGSALHFQFDVRGDRSFGLSKRSRWIIDPTSPRGPFWRNHLSYATFLPSNFSADRPSTCREATRRVGSQDGC